MSFGKMNQFIEIIKTESVKDKDGFSTKQDIVLANVRAYKEERNSTEKWASMATFNTATCLFRFRYLPKLEVTTEMVIVCDNARYQINSVENIRNRRMYLEVLATKVEGSSDG